MEEWKDSRNWALNGIIELLNQPALKPPPPANLIIFCQEVPIKAVEVGDLFVFGVLMNKNGLRHQTGRHPAIPPGRVFFPSRKFYVWMMGQLTHFSQFSLIPPKFRAIGLLEINKCEDAELIFT